MIYHFRAEKDDQLWVFNTEDMTWGKASNILSSPSVGAVENKLAHYQFLESGTLVPQGAGSYTFDGRKPGDAPTCAGILAVPYAGGLVVILDTDVVVKEGSFQANFHEYMGKGVQYELGDRARGKEKQEAKS